MNKDILKNLQSVTTPEDGQWLAFQFSLENKPPLLRDSVYKAVIPHWFDHAFLNAILDCPLNETDFKTLTELPFVEVFPGRGYNIHELIRNLILEKIWLKDKNQYRKYSLKAAEHCIQQDQHDPAWKSETLYHFLIAGNKDAVRNFSSQAIHWYNAPNFAYDELEMLNRPVLDAVKFGLLEGVAAAWAYLINGLLAKTYYDFKKAEINFKLALEQKSNDQAAKSICLYNLADLDKTSYKYKEARVRFIEALKIYRHTGSKLGEANCLKSLGELHHRLNEYQKAKELYEQALQIYREIDSNGAGEAACIKSLGDVHKGLEEYELAQDLYKKALKIQKKRGDDNGEALCILSMGELHQIKNEYQEARESYEQALTIQEQIGNLIGKANSLKLIGDVHQIMDEYKEALDSYEQALKIHRERGDLFGEANCLKSFGELHQRLNEYHEAFACYDQALAIYKQIGDRMGEANCLKSKHYLKKLLGRNSSALT